MFTIHYQGDGAIQGEVRDDELFIWLLPICFQASLGTLTGCISTGHLSTF